MGFGTRWIMKNLFAKGIAPLFHRLLLTTTLLFGALLAHSQNLHTASSCPPGQIQGSVVWGTGTGEYDWTDGATSFTANDVSGTQVDVTFTWTGETSTLAVFNGVQTPNIESSLTGGTEALTLVTNGFTGGGCTLTMALSPPIPGSVGYEIYHMNKTGSAGDEYTISALTTEGATIYPSFTANGTPSWTETGPGVVDANASSTAGQNDQVGVNFTSNEYISSITMIWQDCSTCSTGQFHGAVVGSFDFCIDDWDGDGVHNLTDEDDDNDGILDADEQCSNSNGAGTIDWDSENWSSGSGSGSFTNTSVTATVAYSSDGVALSAINETTTLTGGLGPAQNSLYTTVNQTSNTATVTGSWDFSVPVDNLSFDLFDVDLSGTSYIDSVRIVGYSFGEQFYPTLTAGSANSINENAAVGTSNSAASSSAGNVGVQFNQPIDSMVIYWNNGDGADANPGAQDMSLHDLSWTRSCVNYDYDGDGTPNHLDIDSENDGVMDFHESGIPLADWAALDGNNDGVIDASVAVGTNGVANSIETVADNGILDYTYLDTDVDGIVNRIDIDSDNDGITDLTESGAGTDANSDGIVDGTADADQDGFLDSADSDDDGIGSPGTTPTNSDSDDYPNFIDIDSDDDGIIDNIEAQATTGSPIVPGGSDSDSDGLDDNFESTDGLDPVDTESDGTDDYVDTDSDNDLDTDALEGYDTNNNGSANTSPSGSDSDGDGLDNNFDNVSGWNSTTNVTNSAQDALDFPNLDETVTAERDWREAADCDGDGFPNVTDIDDDNDGILDSVEGAGDADGDGIPNTCDLDSDGDGIFDIIEAGGTDANTDGMVDNFTDVTAAAAYQDSTGCDTNWTAISSPTTPSLTDDGNTDIANPFDFDIFGTTQSGGNIRLNMNGWLSYGTPSVTTYSPVSLPSGTFTNAIAGNWTDISPNNGGTVNYGTNGTSPNRIFLAQWEDTPFFSGSGVAKFQIQLHETTNEIRILTSNFNPSTGSGKTMGVNADGSNGYAISGRNDVVYTITTGECRSIYYVAASTQNGYSDPLETDTLPTPDTDSDGVADFLDIDADGDGIIDLIEAQATTGSPTIPSGTDTDVDGLDNNFETGGVTPVDTDNDGTPDYQDTDSDGDGFLDNLEAYDTDYDGVSETTPSGSDTDGDGLDNNYDNIVGPNSTTNVTNNGQDALDFPNLSNITTSERDWREAPDFDNDGVPDITDLDDDNDGIPDTNESDSNEPDGDEDGDNIPNWQDTTDDGAGDGSSTVYTDADGNGIPDVYDADNDGVPNHHDLDSDNDGVLDLQESGMSSGDIGTLDTNDDGVIDSGQTFGTNGLADNLETSADNGTLDYTVGNTDGNGPIDSQDLDSDNDGILDHAESGAGTDSDEDGIVDGSADADGDGILDSVDSDDAALGSPNTTALDTDTDGVPNLRDIDSDNDGILDIVESGTGTDANADGIVDGSTDSDGDGILESADSQDGTLGSDNQTPTDTDSDNFPNFIDIDSDADGIIDNIEAQGSTATPIIPGGTDSDGDGLDNNYESTNGLTPVDSADNAGAGDGIPDYIDTDSDNDGESDLIEAYDSNDNGVANISPAGTDSDGDGLDNSYDAVFGWNSTTNVTDNGEDAFDYPDHDEGYPELDWRETPCLNGAVTLAVSGSTTSAPSKCKQTPWTYYYNASNPDDLIFAIEKAPGGVGNNTNTFTAEAAITVSATPTLAGGVFSSEDVGNEQATFVMGRYWNVNITSGSLNGTVNVRFFYDPAELSIMESTADAWNTANAGGTGVTAGTQWFKTVSVTFDDGTHITSPGISNSQPLTVAATGTVDGVNYVQFNGVSSFSGGTAAKTIGVNSAILPIDLLSFDATKKGKDVELTWATATEINNDFFTVERLSPEGEWISIGTVEAAGTTKELQHYSLWDLEPYAGLNYYRLKQTDFDGTFEYSDVRVVEFEDLSGISLKVIPNPSNGNFDVEVNSGEEKELEVLLVDGTGRVVKHSKHRSLDGNYKLYFGNIATGSYLLKAITKNYVKTEKVIIH